MKNFFSNKVSLLFLLIAVLLLTSCRKYQEDPFISLKRPHVRLTPDHNFIYGHYGKWLITSYKISGVEHLGDFANLIPGGRSFNECPLIFYAGDRNQWWGQVKFLDSNGADLFVNSDGNRYTWHENNSINISIDDTLGRTLFDWIPQSLSVGAEWSILELYGRTFRITNPSHKIAIEFRRQ